MKRGTPRGKRRVYSRESLKYGRGEVSSSEFATDILAGYSSEDFKDKIVEFLIA